MKRGVYSDDLGIVAASAPVAERSVKLKGISDSQVPQGSGLLC